MIGAFQYQVRAKKASFPSFISAPGKTTTFGEDFREKQLNALRSSAGEPGFLSVPSIVREVTGSRGRALDDHTRAVMESQFGYDFSQVRVHADEDAAESTRVLNALAYTVGRDVVFDTGRYAPQTVEGRRLLAHELTHVIQQKANSTGMQVDSLALSPESGSSEYEAEIVSDQLSNGFVLEAPIVEHGAMIQRQVATGALRPPWMRTQPMYQLHLEPWVQAQANMQLVLDLEEIRRGILSLDLGMIAAAQPPPWLRMPLLEPPSPLVPRGAGPERPREANVGDLLKGVLAVPAVTAALTRLRNEATDRVEHEWSRLSAGEKAIIIGTTALIGAGALTGILSDESARQSALGLLQDRDIPIPFLPGLSFRFHAVGRDQLMLFSLDLSDSFHFITQQGF